MSKVLYENLLKKLNNARPARKETMAQENGYATAVEFKTFLQEQIANSPEATPVDLELTDLVIAFDTTGSMGSFINAVKTHVRNLIPNAFKENPNLKISIVAFGDYCDMQDQHRGVFGKAYQVIGLTDNESDLINFVQNAQNTGGGDSDEFYELVIKKITEETQWREGSSRSILLIGDADPHRSGYGYNGRTYHIDWRKEVQEAHNLGIKIDTLSIAGKRFYKEVAEMTGGVCIPFSQSDSKKTSELVEATTLARGGKNTREAFMAKSISAEVKADAVMDTVYSTYSKDIL